MRPRRALPLIAALALVAAAPPSASGGPLAEGPLAAVGWPPPGGVPPQRGAAASDAKPCVTPKRVAEARRWASGRTGTISFAVLDECKRLVGDHRFRVHYSASVVKVMLMVAYLRRDGVRDDDLTAEEKAMLGPMITSSDNGSANRVYGIVGEEALLELADDAGMRRFSTMPVWGGSEITPGDQASFVGRIERYVPKRHEDYALGLMADVIGPQRWGVPRLTLPGWRIHLKGGWSPQSGGGGWRVNQVALLTDGDRRFSVAIFTSDQPDYAYGQASIEGVGKRLLRAYRRR